MLTKTPYKLLVSIYLIYFICFFKTKWSIHHPLEYYLIKDQPSWLQHPISSGLYQNKICPLGHLSAIALVFWILLRKPNSQGWNRVIWWSVLSIGLLLNLNYVVYLLPIAILDLICN